MCEPREKSQRVSGRERDAGWDFSKGTEKREREAMPPEARRALDMLKIWRARVEAIVEDLLGSRVADEAAMGESVIPRRQRNFVLMLIEIEVHKFLNIGDAWGLLANFTSAKIPW